MLVSTALDVCAPIKSELAKISAESTAVRREGAEKRQDTRWGIAWLVCCTVCAACVAVINVCVYMSPPGARRRSASAQSVIGETILIHSLFKFYNTLPYLDQTIHSPIKFPYYTPLTHYPIFTCIYQETLYQID